MTGNTDQNIEALVNSSFENFKSYFEPGEKVQGIVSAVTRKAIFVDINAKSEGVIDCTELARQGIPEPKPGDSIEAYFLRTGSGGEFCLSIELKAANIDDRALADAYASKIPIEGRVEAERKGGYEIQIGSHQAFCPYSQIDLYASQDKTIYIGQRYSFLISEYNESNLVVSRRSYLEAEHEKLRNQLKETLREGDDIEGTVRRVMDFGVFVDIGGIQGLVPMSEIAWSRVNDANELVRVGEKVTVKVLKIQWESERISLSLKQVGGDPWGRVQDNYHETKQYHGTVRKLMEFGAFVELEPGIDGLIHISKLGAGKRLSHAAEVLKEDEEINVYIESIDAERRRISLSLENPQQGRTMDIEGAALTVGEVIEGTVEDIKQFGIFIKVTASRSGLLHISEIPFTGNANKLREMHKKFPIGEKTKVVINSIREDKISLSLPESLGENESEYREFLANKESGELVSLGDLFGDLKVKKK